MNNSQAYENYYIMFGLYAANPEYTPTNSKITISTNGGGGSGSSGDIAIGEKIKLTTVINRLLTNGIEALHIKSNDDTVEKVYIYIYLNNTPGSYTRNDMNFNNYDQGGTNFYTLVFVPGQSYFLM